MPYIKQEDRLRYDARINALITDILIHKSSAGDMNYIITRLLDAAYNFKEPSYSKINEAIGVLECAKMELYRRVAVLYENKKIELNKDVYKDVYYCGCGHCTGDK